MTPTEHAVKRWQPPLLCQVPFLEGNSDDPLPRAPGSRRPADYPAEKRVILHEYAVENDCITIDEVRWLLRAVGRYSDYYMFFLLRVTEGPRTAEVIEHFTLYTLFPNLAGFEYEIKKPGRKPNRHDELVEKHKHRRIKLDPWVREELRIYLNLHMRVVDGIYVSPHPHQRLFPFKNTQVVAAYWWKLKQKMERSGFEANRKLRDWRRDTAKRQEIPVFVCRPHILRHFACSIFYIKCGKDIIKTMRWIGHSNIETTKAYLHTPESMGLTEEQILKMSWPELLGFDDHQESIGTNTAPEQTSLQMYGE